MYLKKIVEFLWIDYYRYLPIEACIKELKEAKSTYLLAKSNTYSLRDQYIDSALSELKKKRNAKKLKAYWKNLKKTFGKPRMTSISAVEYMLSGSRVRVSE